MFVIMRYDKPYCLANMRKFNTFEQAEEHVKKCRIDNLDTVYNILEVVKSVGKRESKHGY